MYRYSVDNAVTYLPSDIILFRESPFAAWMERLALENPDHGIPADTNSQPPKDIAERQDDLVDTLRAEGRDVVLVDWERPEPERRADTLDAMRSGADFIVNGRLALGTLSGNVNMLMRTSGFSELGDFLYIPCDTQGGTGLNAGFRLAFFADLLQRLQGQMPPQLLVIYPDAAVVPLQTDDYIHYYRAVKERFMQAMSNFRKHRMPDPAESAHFGRWSECAAEVLKQRAQSADYQRGDTAEPDERPGSETVAQRLEGYVDPQADVSSQDQAAAQVEEQVAYAVAEMPVAAVAGQPPMRDMSRGAALHEMSAGGVAAETTARAAGGGLTLVEQARSLSPDAYRSRKAPGRTPNLAHFPVPENAPAARDSSPARSRDSGEVLENLEFIGSSQPAPLYDSRPLRPAAPRRESLRPAVEAETGKPDPTAADVSAADAAAMADEHGNSLPDAQDAFETQFDGGRAPSPSLREIPVPEPFIEGYEVELIDLEAYDERLREPLLLPPDYSAGGVRAGGRDSSSQADSAGRESVIDLDSPQRVPDARRRPLVGAERNRQADDAGVVRGKDARPPFGSSLITNRDFDSDD